MKLLFVDDDLDLLNINTKYFSKYNYQVITSTNGINIMEIVKSTSPDCIILDIMMPDIDGYSICESIRAYSDTPIIFVSGLTKPDNKIKGLLLGADDYITKPYSLKELRVRINVILRRTNTPSSKDTLEYPPLYLDLMTHKAYHNKEEILLSNKEYDLLRVFCQSPNTILTYQELGEKVWGYYIESDKQTIMVTTSRLRKKLSYYQNLKNCIQSVRSKGYTFIYHKGV